MINKLDYESLGRPVPLNYPGTVYGIINIRYDIICYAMFKYVLPFITVTMLCLYGAV